MGGCQVTVFRQKCLTSWASGRGLLGVFESHCPTSRRVEQMLGRHSGDSHVDHESCDDVDSALGATKKRDWLVLTVGRVALGEEEVADNARDERGDKDGFELGPQKRVEVGSQKDNGDASQAYL